MAVAEMQETQDADSVAPAKKSAKLLIVLGGVAALLLLVVAGGAGYLLSSRGDAAKEPAAAGPPVADSAPDQKTAETSDKPPVFLSLKPAFVVNFNDGQTVRYLQVDIDLMARDQKVIDTAKDLAPMLRHSVLEILGKQGASIYTQEGKDKLRQDIRTTLQSEVKTPDGTLEEVFFTSFVVQ